MIYHVTWYHRDIAGYGLVERFSRKSGPMKTGSGLFWR